MAFQIRLLFCYDSEVNVLKTKLGEMMTIWDIPCIKRISEIFKTYSEDELHALGDQDIFQHSHFKNLAYGVIDSFYEAVNHLRSQVPENRRNHRR